MNKLYSLIRDEIDTTLFLGFYSNEDLAMEDAIEEYKKFKKLNPNDEFTIYVEERELNDIGKYIYSQTVFNSDEAELYDLEI
jgi:hypothetical protein